MNVLVSKTKLVFLLILINITTLNSRAESEPSRQEGLAIGVINKIDRPMVFFKNKLLFDLSALPLGNKVYPSIPLKLMINNDNLLQKVIGIEHSKTSKPVIVSYKITSPLIQFPLLGLKHRITLSDIQTLVSPNQVINWNDSKFRKPSNIMKASGYLLRWYQRGSFDHLCSVSIHLGGERTAKKAFHSETLIGINKDGEKEEDIEAIMINESQQNIGHFNITSKDGCLAAKSYLKAGKMVEIGFAKHYFHLFKTFKHSIHSIKFQNPTNSEITALPTFDRQ